MESKTHIIDPDGEVIIVLHNPDGFVAEWIDRKPWWGLGKPPSSWGYTFDVPLGSTAPEPEVESNDQDPAQESDYPAQESDYPAQESDYPAQESDYPAQESDYPAQESDYPAQESDYPAQESDCDNDSKANHRFQVSMKHLTLASPVFKTSLTGLWKASATLAQKGVVEIPADGWDSEAFLILLQAIHCQNDRLPKQLPLEMIAKIAVLADYYQCMKVLGFCAHIWVQALKKPPTTICRDLLLWLWISHVFRLSDEFKQVTSTVMSKNIGPIACLGLPLSLDLVGKMNTSRESSIGDIFDRLHKAQADLLNGKQGCSFPCRSIAYGALTLQMHTQGLLSPAIKPPYRGVSYQELVKQILEFTLPSLNRYDCYCCQLSFPQVFDHPSDSISGLE